MSGSKRHEEVAHHESVQKPQRFQQSKRKSEDKKHPYDTRHKRQMLGRKGKTHSDRLIFEDETKRYKGEKSSDYYNYNKFVRMKVLGSEVIVISDDDEDCGVKSTVDDGHEKNVLKNVSGKQHVVTNVPKNISGSTVQQREPVRPSVVSSTNQHGMPLHSDDDILNYETRMGAVIMQLKQQYHCGRPGILISDNFHAAVGDMILCLVQFFCRKYDVPWNAEVLVASALNDADFEEKMKALYRCAIEANENDLKKVEEDLLEIAKGVVRRCRVDLQCATEMFENDNAWVSELSVVQQQLERSENEVRELKRRLQAANRNERDETEKIRQLERQLSLGINESVRKERESEEHCGGLSEQVKLIELSALKKVDGGVKISRLEEELAECQRIIERLERKNSQLSLNFSSVKQVAIDNQEKYKLCEKELAETRLKWEQSSDDSGDREKSLSKVDSSVGFNSMELKLLRTANAGMDVTVKHQAEQLRFFSRILRENNAHLQAGIKRFWFTFEPMPGLWNYEEFMLDDFDQDTLLDPLYVTEGVIQLMMTEYLVKISSDIGLNQRRFYVYYTNFFNGIQNADGMCDDEEIASKKKSVPKIEDSGKSEETVKMAISQKSENVGKSISCGNSKKNAGNRQLAEQEARVLIKAPKPEGFLMNWDDSAKQDDFDKRYAKCVDKAAHMDIWNDSTHNRTNSMFQKSGIFMPVGVCEHWMLAIYLNASKLKACEKEIFGNLFPGNKSITISDSGFLSEPVEVDLEKDCLILLDSKLSFPLPRGQISKCLKRFLCSWYIEKFEASEEQVAQMREMPCYVPRVTQQGLKPDCGLFIGEFFKRLLTGEPLDPENYQPDMDKVRKEWLVHFEKTMEVCVVHYF